MSDGEVAALQSALSDKNEGHEVLGLRSAAGWLEQTGLCAATALCLSMIDDDGIDLPREQVGVARASVGRSGVLAGGRRSADRGQSGAAAARCARELSRLARCDRVGAASCAF